MSVSEVRYEADVECDGKGGCLRTVILSEAAGRV